MTEPRRDPDPEDPGPTDEPTPNADPEHPDHEPEPAPNDPEPGEADAPADDGL